MELKLSEWISYTTKIEVWLDRNAILIEQIVYPIRKTAANHYALFVKVWKPKRKKFFRAKFDYWYDGWVIEAPTIINHRITKEDFSAFKKEIKELMKLYKKTDDILHVKQIWNKAIDFIIHNTSLGPSTTYRLECEKF